MRCICAVLFPFALSLSAVAAPRDVKIDSIDLAAGVVELTNHGSEAQSLNGWRFCSNNTSVVLQYTGASGLNGRTLTPGQSLYVHLNNDAPADPDRVNRSALGGVFAPLDETAFALAIYFPDGNGVVNFNLGSQIADFLQFSLNGANNTTANIRTDEAVNGGVWASLTDWIDITTFSTGIQLVDTASVVSDSSDFAVTEPCLADLAEPFGTLNFFDVSAFLGAFNAQQPSADLAAPFGLWNFFDVSAFLAAFNAGCP